MTRQLWRMAGFNAASIGTLGITTSLESASTGLTTPDIVTFLSNMSGLAAEGVTPAAIEARSEERRVGKECVRPCRTRWSHYLETIKNNITPLFYVKPHPSICFIFI